MSALAENKKVTEEKKPEPILTVNPSRFVLFPLQNMEVWEMYKKHLSLFWVATEIDFAQDKKDWESLNEDEQHFLKWVFAFFAASDGIVNENLGDNFMTEVQLPEARCFYGFQIMIENIHSETYSLLIDTYITDNKEKDLLFNAIEHIPCIQEKAKWAMKWMKPEDNCFLKRLVAFSCIEGIHFSGSFCAIFWMKKRGLMPGLTFSNELISRDEGLHTDFACLLYKQAVNKLTDEEIHSIVREAVEIEQMFICDAIPCKLIGMNSDMMKTYIEFIADRLIYALGHPKIYNVENPFEWMEMISLTGKTNFMERRVSEYQKSGVMNSLKEQNRNFCVDEDF
jgi:ribonucleotide reductase beta subunit family protein with ferritin-like domain